MEMATHFGKKLGLSLGMVSGFALLATASIGHAQVNYGNFTGTSVEYLNVTDGSATNPALFGMPAISNDSLVFSPPDFSAVSENGAPTDTTTGDLTTTVVGLGSMGISNLQINDAGDYTLLGSGTSATNVTLSAPVTLNILAINGSPVTPIPINTSLTFSPQSSYSLPTNMGTGVIWTGSLNADLAAAIAGAGDTGTATQVSVAISDTLTASSELGTIAEIEKKTHDVISITTTISAVPEPTSLGLFAIAGGALLKRRGRK
jgi:hypothetical protein